MTTGLERGAGSSAPRSEDVARLAGVSRKTVSRVLNNEPYVSEESRRRVLAAAEELGYRLNHAARALASGRTRSIGVVALATAGYGTASLLVGIEQAVRDAGYALRVVNTPDGDPQSIAGALESLLEQEWTASSSPYPSSRAKSRSASTCRSSSSERPPPSPPPAP